MESDEKLARAYHQQANYSISIGDERAVLRLHTVALDIIQNTDNSRLETLILGMMVTSLTRLGELNRAADTAEAAMNAAEELGDDEILAMTRTNVAFFYAEAGDIVKATQMLEQQITVCHKLNKMDGETIGRINLGYNYIHLGLYTLGRSVLEKALDLSARIGARRLNAFARYNLALALWREGDLNQAASFVTGAHQDMEEIGYAFGAAAGLSYDALILESLGELEKAIDKFSCAKESFEELGARAYAVDALAGIVRCQPARKKPGVARKKNEQLWEYLVTSGSEGMEFPMSAYQACAEVFLLFNEPSKARESIEKGHSELMEQAAKISNPAWRTSFLQNVPEHKTLAAMWTRLEAVDFS